MFYEEKEIDGIMHSRHMPNGQFKPMSLEDLTASCLLYKSAYEELKADHRELKIVLGELRLIVDNAKSEFEELKGMVNEVDKETLRDAYNELDQEILDKVIVERDCSNCKHRGNQMILPSGCTGCGVDGEHKNWGNK